MTEQTERYVVVQSDDETSRLHLQSTFIEPQTRRVLEHTRLGSGMRALEVGSGAGDVMRLMGAIVGKQGKVDGIDLNGAMGARVTAELNREGLTTYSFTAGSFFELDSLPNGPYDLVITRMVYIHLRDTEVATRKLWSWVKPAGVLAIMEHDFRLLDSEPESEVAAILRQTFHAVHQHAGLDGRCGAKLPAIFQKALGSAPDGVEAATRLLPIAELAPLLRSSYHSYMDVAERLGVTGLPARDTFDVSLSRAIREDVSFFMPLLVSAWKRKI